MPPTHPSCPRILSEIEALKVLAEEARRALTEGHKTGEYERAVALHEEIREKLKKAKAEFYEEFSPFEKTLRLKEQYEAQKEILERIGILELLSSGEKGIKGIDGKEYPIPSLEAVRKRMRENKEILKLKTEQGFTKLLLVPFGMKLDDLIQKYREVILKHHKEGKLFATKEDPKDPDEPLGLNEDEPVWVWEKYKDADKTGKLVYRVKEFSQNHEGKTKTQILEETDEGWQILLVEDNPNIPREGKGKETGKDENKRQEPEAGKTPEEYLKILQEDPQYKDEEGMTPESQIIFAITRLEETNEVIDDWQGRGSVSYQIGAWFPAPGDVPGAYWFRDSRQANLDRDGPRNRDGFCGVRFSVPL